MDKRLRSPGERLPCQCAVFGDARGNDARGNDGPRVNSSAWRSAGFAPTGRVARPPLGPLPRRWAVRQDRLGTDRAPDAVRRPHHGASLVRGVDYSEFQELFRAPDDRLELVLETVAEALSRFRRHLAAGSWQARGGASLATYFLDTCRAVLPAKIRKYQIQHKLWLQLQGRRNELAGCEGEAIDPETLVVGHMHVIGELDRLDQRTRAIVTLLMNDFTAAEIAELLGESSRAVEGALYRWRRATQLRSGRD